MDLMKRRRNLLIGKPKPYDTEIEYLMGDGKAYINTGLRGNLNTEIGITFTPSSTALSPMMGSRKGNNNITVWVNGNTAADQRFGAWNTKKTFNVGTQYEVSINKTSLIVNGDVTQINYSTTFTTNSNIGIFTVFNGYYGTCRVFSAYIKQDGVLAQDLIPVRVGQVGYLYDKVSGQLFGNVGTGNFILGPDI